MSVEQMSIVWKKQVPSNRLGMLLALADHAHDDGSNVYPSAAHLAWKVGMSERHVRSVLKELHAENVLIKVKKATPQHPTVWRLNLDALADKRSWEEVREEHLSAKRSRGQAEPAAEARAEESSAQDEEVRAEDIAVHGRKSMQFRAEVQSSAEPSRGTVIEPSGSVEKTSFSTGGGSDEPAPTNEVKPKAQSPGNYGVTQLMERHSAAKKANRNPLPLPERDRRQYGEWYAAYLRDGSEAQDLEPVLDYLIARACGEIENEKKAWIGFGTAFDSVANSTANVAKSFYERQQTSADKPRKPEWYMAFYGGSPDYYQSLIDDGYGHDDILSEAITEGVSRAAV